ncbi:MAG: hypothetical protein WKF59_07935 [Chitinophagaceae bacterium]
MEAAEYNLLYLKINNLQELILEDFDFDARFSVVSATVYFSGANFPNVTTGIYQWWKFSGYKCSIG